MNANAATRIERKPFGKTAAGEPVELFTFTRAGAPTVAITNLGGHIVSILAPDRDGKVADVTLGYRHLRRLPDRHIVLRRLVGRYANRIAKGRFTLDGKAYTLATNNGPNRLHGGLHGFHKGVWAAKVRERARGRRARADLRQQGRRGGLPGHPDREGRLHAAGRRRASDRLRGHHRHSHGASTSPTTPTSTWPARARATSSATRCRSRPTPTRRWTRRSSRRARCAPVEGTPFDFRKPSPIGARIDAADEQLQAGRRLRPQLRAAREGGRAAPRGARRGAEERPRAGGADHRAGHPVLHRQLPRREVIGASGKPYVKRGGFCLEAQHYPDSPNRPSFPRWSCGRARPTGRRPSIGLTVAP